MIPLPLANVVHHKLRSGLSALGVGIAVCMLITLTGLTRGSLNESASRWEAVEADLIVYPRQWDQKIFAISGWDVLEADAERVGKVTVGGRLAAARVAGAVIAEAQIGPATHNVVGVAPQDLPMLVGGRKVHPGGRVFDPEDRFARWLEDRLATAGGDVSAAELAAHGGLEMVIDSRLARAAGLKLGGKVTMAGHEFTIVGIVNAGGLARAFVPKAAAQYILTSSVGRSTLLFVKLHEGVAPGPALAAIRDGGKRLSAVPLSQYRAILFGRFGAMYHYADAVNAVTLIVAFLFILVTLYTMVLQRTREIAILKSLGATRRFILGQVLSESMLLSAGGLAAGVAMSLPAGACIRALAPFLTVTITWKWVALAALAAAVGGAAAAMYPAWCAMRVDVAEAMNIE